MKTSYEILEEMERVLDNESLSKARILLLDSSLRLVGKVPTKERVNQLLPTLKARLNISQDKGKLIYGLSHLIQVLLVLDQNLIVEGYGFTSSNTSGKFYYLECEDKPLGATLVD